MAGAARALGVVPGGPAAGPDRDAVVNVDGHQLAAGQVELAVRDMAALAFADAPPA